jgi:hypothetical protein
MKGGVVVQLYLISRNTGISDQLIAALDHQPGFTIETSANDPKRLLFVWPVDRVSDAMALVDRKLSTLHPFWPSHLLVGG